jgi:hypothetical protein
VNKRDRVELLIVANKIDTVVLSLKRLHNNKLPKINPNKTIGLCEQTLREVSVDIEDLLFHSDTTREIEPL